MEKNLEKKISKIVKERNYCLYSIRNIENNLVNSETERFRLEQKIKKLENDVLFYQNKISESELLYSDEHKQTPESEIIHAMEKKMHLMKESYQNLNRSYFIKKADYDLMSDKYNALKRNVFCYVVNIIYQPTFQTSLENILAEEYKDTKKDNHQKTRERIVTLLEKSVS